MKNKSAFTFFGSGVGCGSVGAGGIVAGPGRTTVGAVVKNPDPSCILYKKQ